MSKGDERTIAGVSMDRWRELCDEYVRKMKTVPAEQQGHAGCDHGNGYCQEA